MTGLTNVPGGEATRARGRSAHAVRRPAEVDMLVIGAGATGLYQLYRARTEGFSALLLEAGLGVGGIWYWNNSFEACFEADSSMRGHLFSAELGAERERPPEGAGQPGIERYLNHLVDRHDLRRDIRLGARVRSAVYDDSTGTWSVLASGGEAYRARYVVAATGALLVPLSEATDAGRRAGGALGAGSGAYGDLGVCGGGILAVGDRALGGGALTRLGVRGRDGLRLSGYWAAGPRTYLGVMTAGFPNFFFPGGPHGLPDNPRHPGDQVDLVTGALLHARDTGREVVEVGLAAEEEWTDLVRGTLVSSLLNGGRSRDSVMTADDAFGAFIFSEAGRAA
ncbi:hypothetical protein [Streptomyces sp. NPDC097610]|uniref:hypothetical protein n=1 Tax=Streptomyces sp. NPDC097610 TaxID=3157227 RepID=UPI003324FE84